MPKSDPLVSVIIPAYEAARYIEETIRSVFQQTHSNLEIIVVDDGSPDNQGALVEKLAAEDDRLQYVKQKNGGVSSARNRGFELSKGTYLAFLDADDVWQAQNLEKKLAKFKTDLALGLVHSDTTIIDEDSKRTGETKSGKEGYLLDDLLLWNGTCIPTPSSILIKREVMEKVGGFDLELSNAADKEFFLRVAQKYKIGRVPEVTWQYRVHTENMHKNIALMEKDELLAYKRADENKLFKSPKFRRQCYANMYMIVGASWWGDGQSKGKGLKYLLKALWIYPPAIRSIFNKLTT